MNISNYPCTYVIKLNADGFIDGGVATILPETTSKEVPYFTRILYPNPKFHKPKIDGATLEDGEFVGGKWIDGEDPAILAQYAEDDRVSFRTQIKLRLYEVATRQINILQDAADYDEATDEELALLKQWKLYRHKLGTTDATSTVEFPVMPATIDGTTDTYDSIYQELAGN